MVRLNNVKYSSHNNTLVSNIDSDDQKYDKDIEYVARQHNAVKLRKITDYSTGMKNIIHSVFFNNIADKEGFERDLSMMFPQ